MKENDSSCKSLLKISANENDYNLFLNSRRMQNKENKTITGVPYPFLKWAGGKRQLIPQMEKFISKKFNNYIESFVGGGALFFYLLPKKALLLDNNFELINCYKVIQNNVYELIESLKRYIYNKDLYYKIRTLDRNYDEYNSLSNIEKAARTIFLNKTGYNGLYRVNQKGFFNVPFGRHKNPKICDKKNLIAAHHALKNIEIIHGSFELSIDFAKKGDFVYLDPPYFPLSSTSLFTSYTKYNFGKHAQIQLYETFKSLDQKGCKLLLNNSYSEFILELYKEYTIEIVKAKRAINSKSTKRGEIKEVLIMN